MVNKLPSDVEPEGTNDELCARFEKAIADADKNAEFYETENSAAARSFFGRACDLRAMLDRVRYSQDPKVIQEAEEMIRKPEPRGNKE